MGNARQQLSLFEPSGPDLTVRGRPRLSFAGTAAGLLSEIAEALDELQDGDPLREVVVLTPPGATAGTLRRLLPRTRGGRGVAGLRFTTAVDWALDVAGHDVKRRMPVTPQLLASAIRTILAGPRCPEPLIAVRDHRSTLDALVEVSERLRTLDLAPGAAAVEAALAGSSGTRRAVIDVALSARRALVAANYRDEASVIATAQRRLASRSDEGDDDLPVLVVMAEPFHVAHVPFVAALVARSSRAVIVASRPEVGDSVLAEQVERISGTTGAPARFDPVSPPTSITSCPDQDEEVRHVVRTIVARSVADEAVPLHRVVVAYPPGDGYERRICDELERAHVEWTGRAPGTLAGSVAGQVVRALLDVLSRPDRVRIFALLDVAPRWTSPTGTPRPVSSWRRLCRELGVVTRADWSDLPARLARRQADRAARRAEPEAWMIERDEREQDLVARLVELVVGIERSARSLRTATSWTSTAVTLGAVLRLHIGDRAWRERHWGTLPEWQRRAADQVQGLLGGLAALDDVDLGQSFSADDVAPVVRGLLDAPIGRQGEPTVGVRVLPLIQSVILDADVVFVLGLSDGVLPVAPNEDLIVRRELPSVAAPWVEPGDWAAQRARRSWVALLEGDAEVHATWARSDLRRGGERYPSQWLNPWLGDSARCPRHDSHASGLTAGPALSTGELVLAEGDAALSYYELLRERVRTIRSRLQPDPTEFDGVIGSQAVCHPGHRIQSITGFELLATCGISYLFRHVLAVDDLVDPAEITTIEGRDRGTLVHAALEGLVRHWLALDPRPPWREFAASAASTSVVESLVDDEADRLSADNRLGHETAWRLERRLLLDAVAAALSRDVGDGSEPLAVEYEFGFRESAPFVVATGGGEVEFRGKIDRIDRVGDTVRVTDFKSSTSPNPTASGPRPANPTLDGTKLQLPLYAAVAERDFGGSGRSARYLYLHQSKASPHNLPDEAHESYLREIDRLARRMAGGEFYPGAPNDRFGCDACAPDGLGLESVGLRASRWASDVETTVAE